MFTVTKGKNLYTVKEYEKKWTASTSIGKLTVDYHIDKEICATRKDVEKYIESETVFLGGNHE